MNETVEARAVKIAAKIMQAAGLCRYDSVSKCRRVYVDESTCDKCIRSWLLLDKCGNSVVYADPALCTLKE